MEIALLYQLLALLLVLFVIDAPEQINNNVGHQRRSSSSSAREAERNIKKNLSPAGGANVINEMAFLLDNTTCIDIT